MSDKKEIKGRWFIIIPIVLYSIFVLWSYFPIITYVVVSLLAIVSIIAHNVIIYKDYYKPYYSNVEYYKKNIKYNSYYLENGTAKIYIENITQLKAEYDKRKYYYIVFWLKIFYDYIIVSSYNGINYLFNQLIKVCIYVDEKLTVKL